MSSKLKGLYGDNVIWINKNIPTQNEKHCILAEEMGHHCTSYGNILDQKCVNNRKQEKRARNWAYERLVPLHGLVSAFNKGYTLNRYDLADYLGVTENFLEHAIDRYKQKYGIFVRFRHYKIFFDPLNIIIERSRAK